MKIKFVKLACVFDSICKIVYYVDNVYPLELVGHGIGPQKLLQMVANFNSKTSGNVLKRS